MSPARPGLEVEDPEYLLALSLGILSPANWQPGRAVSTTDDLVLR
jgi:hypothetical protein